ncbi:TPA: hypothetical protein ACH3X1_009071 [Trebouxia sp. C0004]
MAILALLLSKRRRQKQLLVLKRESTSTLIGSSGTSDSRESRFFNPMVPQESLGTRLSSGFQSFLIALHLATPHANVQYALDSDSGSKSGLALGAVAERKAHTKIVHASIINKDEIDICKSASGEDWLLGMGSYGMVPKARPSPLFLPLPKPLLALPPPTPLPLPPLYLTPTPTHAPTPAPI